MACEDCGLNRPIMVPMQPGRDRQPWELCGKCWVDGIKPHRMNNFGKTTQIADPLLYKALVAQAERTTGLIDRDKVNADLAAARKRAG